MRLVKSRQHWKGTEILCKGDPEEVAPGQVQASSPLFLDCWSFPSAIPNHDCGSSRETLVREAVQFKMSQRRKEPADAQKQSRHLSALETDGADRATG